ncbi:MAG: zinc ribbon domain-containing protein [Desulfovibrionaceae bacterium]|nr:zinc ribbon domain-containing protein [Desulfovibrionaceae bacterium]
MPIYEYRCQDCDKVFEKIERSFDEHAEACPVCGGESKRIISNTSFVLKGSGWYVTDYCNRHGGADSGGNGDNGSKAKDGAASDSASAASDATSPASSTSGTSGDKAPAAASCSTACSGCGAAAAK